MAYQQITYAEARKDLFTNPNAPLVFRSYMNDYHAMMVNEWQQSYPTLTDAQLHRIKIECGRHVTSMIHTCGWSREFAYDPNTEYRFEAIEEDGRQNSQNALKYIIGGPCSSWTGHAGYCWNKTMADNRPHAATGPDGGGPEVRSELDGYILPRIPVYWNNIRTAR